MMKEAIYPIEPWTITEEVFSLEDNFRNETTFALSNGYIGTRGTLEEGYDFTVKQGLEGNFINGFYESEPIRYGEWNFGFPEKSQSLLNLPNLKKTEIIIDGEKFNLFMGTVEKYQRTLHMNNGHVSRDIVWLSPKGHRIHFKTTRFVSLTNKNLMAQQMKVIPLNFSGEIRFVSVLDAQVENHTRETNPLIDYGPYGRKLLPISLSEKEGQLLYKGKTTNSHLYVGCGSLHELNTSFQKEAAVSGDLLYGSITYKVMAKKDQPIKLTKYMVYSSSLDMDEKELMPFLKPKRKDMGF